MSNYDVASTQHEKLFQHKAAIRKTGNLGCDCLPMSSHPLGLVRRIGHALWSSANPRKLLPSRPAVWLSEASDWATRWRTAR